MKLNQFTEILRSLKSLTSNQISLLRHRIDGELKRSGISVQIDKQKEQDEILCPHCGSEYYQRWGTASKLQRYRCKACLKTYNSLTKTPFARLRKRELWEKNLDCMVFALPLRAVAEELQVALTTAFRWRHRFLNAPSHDRVSQLSGVIECDEFFLIENFKGNHTIMDRRVRKRGGLGDKRFEDLKIPILIAKDRSGGITDFVLTNNSKVEIHEALEPIVPDGTLLCTDGASAYRTFAKNRNIKHYRNISSQGTRVINKVFHIQNVNNYISRFRTWLKPFRGVSTGYLEHYLSWFRELEQSKKKYHLAMDDFISKAFLMAK